MSDTRGADPDLSGHPLVGLATSLGHEPEAWLARATTPLPETVRVSTTHPDSKRVRAILEGIGGQANGWFPQTAEIWTMPWERGGGGASLEVIRMLHSSGRITRQEAASMIPVELMAPFEDDLVLDLCAAPGSKATQIASATDGRSLVIANEPSNGRLNLLTTNRSRLGVEDMLIVQHDARHFPRIPGDGASAILVDAPCTGTATTRKNWSVWKKWAPEDGRRMHRLQVDISVRAARLLEPGGRMVYSTCSIDPVENEAVVVAILHACPWLRLDPIHPNETPGLTLQSGVDEWSLIDAGGQPHRGAKALGLPGADEAHLCPTDRGEEGPDLSACRRLAHADNDTGGFFLARFLHHPIDEDPRAIGLRQPRGARGHERTPPTPGRHETLPASTEDLETLASTWGFEPDAERWWRRGKQLIRASPKARWLWEAPHIDARGGRWPGGHWMPMKVIHAGLPMMRTDGRGWRPRQDAMMALGPCLGARVMHLDRSQLRILLDDGEVPVPEDGHAGSVVFEVESVDGTRWIPGWSGQRLSLMIDEDERGWWRLMLEGSD